jgi:hypothetical protein
MLTEDQKLNRKNVLYALRNANEAEERFNGGVFDAENYSKKTKMCFIGYAATTLGADVRAFARKNGIGVTQRCIDYVANYTGWAEETLYQGVDHNDDKMSWSTIADELELTDDA